MLLANQSTLMQCPVRFMAGSASSVEPQLRSNWNKSGCNRNQQYRGQTTDSLDLYAVTPGVYPPYTWLIPERNGAMASHDNTVIGITCTGTLYGGVTAASIGWTIGISFPPTTDAELVSTVAAGGAPTTFGISTNVPLLTASISGDNVGQLCNIGIDTNVPTLGAVASLTILPTIFGLSGTLTSHAIGIMEGTTADAGVTVDNIVTALQAAVLPVDIVKVNSYTVTGTGQLGNEWGP